MTEIGKMRKTIATHNPVLVHFDGGDGFKTGYTCSAGYNIVASASRDGHRLIAIVLGEDKPAKRAAKTNALLEHGFKWLAWKSLFPAATIHSMPSEFYDREKVIAANLDQRWKDCQDPIPTPEQIAKVAKKDPKKAAVLQAKLDAALAADAAEGGKLPRQSRRVRLLRLSHPRRRLLRRQQRLRFRTWCTQKYRPPSHCPPPRRPPRNRCCSGAARNAPCHRNLATRHQAKTRCCQHDRPCRRGCKVKPRVSVKVGLERQPPAKRREADGVPFTFSP